MSQIRKIGISVAGAILILLGSILNTNIALRLVSIAIGLVFVIGMFFQQLIGVHKDEDYSGSINFDPRRVRPTLVLNLVKKIPQNRREYALSREYACFERHLTLASSRSRVQIQSRPSETFPGKWIHEKRSYINMHAVWHRKHFHKS